MNRNTIQKSRIHDFLEKACSHPTAEDTYREVRKEIPTISLATVYRNLNIMVEEGTVSCYEVNKEAHFDGNTRPHDHLLCRRCGEIIDLQDTGILGRLDKACLGNFVPECVLIYGHCMRCKDGKDTRKH